MKRFGILLTALVTVVLLPESTWAQQPVVQKQPYRRRPSPSLTYLNLYRGRASGGLGRAALNYYTLVRPELELRRRADYQAGQIQQLGGQVQSLEQAQTSGVQSTLPATGHQSFFLNYSHFYPGLQP